MAQTGCRRFVGKFSSGFAPGVSLHQWGAAFVLPGGCSLAGFADVSIRCCSLLVGCFWSYAGDRIACEFPSDRGSVVWSGGCRRIVRRFQRKLDAYHENYRAAANLPEAWRGRKAALISDLHLGHVRNGSFLRRMVAKILKEEPDAIFIAGDLYDGTAIDAKRAAAPLSKLTAPQGVYFVAGNHEQFGDDSKYLRAVEAAGVRVLSNEKIEADGLQIIGVPYRHATHDAHFASVLKGVGVDRQRASILLTHAPDHPEVAEAAGVSLQPPDIRMLDNSFHGAGWRGESTASLCTD